VIEATYLSAEADLARRFGHLTARQAARVAQESGVRKLVLTHFSQRYTSVEPFVAEAKQYFENVVAANDGDTIPVPPRA
jgi:ribonuclease Z